MGFFFPRNDVSDAGIPWQSQGGDGAVLLIKTTPVKTVQVE